MSDAVPLALLDRFEHGRELAPARLEGIGTRVRTRLDRRRRWARNTAAVIAAAVAGAVAWQILGPKPEPEPIDTGPALVVDSAVLEAVAVPRAPADAPRDAQAAAVCDVGNISGPGAGYADAPDPHFEVCRPVWLGDGALIDVAGTTVSSDEDGTVRIAWRLTNIGERLLPLELAGLTATVVDADAAGTATVPLLGTVADAEDADGLFASATASSLWTLDGLRYVPTPAGAAGSATLEPGRTVNGEATLSAGSLDADAVLRVDLQVAVTAPDGSASPVVLEASSGVWTPPATTTAIAAGATPREPGALAGLGADALLCPGTADAREVVQDRWGWASTWTPACTPVTVADGPLSAVTVRSDLDRTAYTRVVRWTARNDTGRPLVVDLTASTVTLEREPATDPSPEPAWWSTAHATARTDTLWRTDGSRTAVIHLERGVADPELAVLAPGEQVAGSAEFFFEELDTADAAAWGSRLERSRAVVHLVVRGVAPADTLVVLELAQP